MASQHGSLGIAEILIWQLASFREAVPRELGRSFMVFSDLALEVSWHCFSHIVLVLNES